jgi:hypothetical protein
MANLPSTRVFDLVEEQFEVLADALDLEATQADTCRDLLRGLRDRSLELSRWQRPRWSGLSDDCSPYEWSFVVRNGQPDVRLLIEAQADPPSAASYWSAAMSLTEWLRDAMGAETSRLDTIRDLFAPSDPDVYFACWHGLEFPAHGPPRAKIYLNPAAQGIDRSGEVCAEACERLGFGPAWDLTYPCLDRAPLSHLSLDLTASSSARLKIYLRVRDAETAEALYVLGARSQVGDATTMIKTLTGDGQLRWPAYVVFHFTEPAQDRPVRSVLNIHVPSACGDDMVASERIRALLRQCDLDPGPYACAIEALATVQYVGDSPFRPPGRGRLAGQRGLHSYVSFQRAADGPRLTVYLGLRAFAARFGWLAVEPVRTWPSPARG